MYKCLEVSTSAEMYEAALLSTAKLYNGVDVYKSESKCGVRENK